MKSLFIFIMMFTNLYAQDFSVKSLSGAILIDRQDNGDYRVYCEDGSKEIVQALDLKINNVCPHLTRVPDYNYLSVHRRADGQYNVICKDLSMIVATRDQLIDGQLCLEATIDLYNVVENVKYIPTTSSYFCDYYQALDIKHDSHGSLISFRWRCESSDSWFFECQEGSCKESGGSRVITLERGNHRSFLYKSRGNQTTMNINEK